MYDIRDLYKDIANDMPLLAVYRKYGGFRIYIPQQDPNFKELVINDFNGSNHHRLADKYNIALSTIYRILKEK